MVLLCGLAFAITIAIIEFCWKTSSLNTSSTGNNKLMQTSPNRRNSRRRSTSFKVRTRKSLCAEIAGTLVPYKFNYSNKTATCVSRKNVSKMRKTTVRSSNNEHNQTIEKRVKSLEQVLFKTSQADRNRLFDHIYEKIKQVEKNSLMTAK